MLEQRIERHEKAQVREHEKIRAEGVDSGGSNPKGSSNASGGSRLRRLKLEVMKQCKRSLTWEQRPLMRIIS